MIKMWGLDLNMFQLKWMILTQKIKNKTEKKILKNPKIEKSFSPIGCAIKEKYFRFLRKQPKWFKWLKWPKCSKSVTRQRWIHWFLPAYQLSQSGLTSLYLGKILANDLINPKRLPQIWIFFNYPGLKPFILDGNYQDPIPRNFQHLFSGQTYKIKLLSKHQNP